MIGWIERWRPTPPIIIETERFILRTVGRRRLARQSFAWSRDEALLNGLGWPAGPYTSRTWRRNFWRSRSGRILHFGIFTRDRNRLIGANGLDLRADRSATMYIAIGDHAWWGRNVVTEVRTAILDYAFAQPGVHRVFGQVGARNFASIFNYQALGFIHEGTLRRHQRLGPDRYVDMLIFGMLKEEWQARRVAKGEAT